MFHDDALVTTGVDSLIELLRKKPKLSIEEAAKHLKVKETLVQSWVDFLLEEEIIGVEYKFITPYLYLIKDRHPTETLDSKEQFFMKARQKHIPEDKIETLWKQYVTQNLNSIKERFYKKALRRNIDESRIDQLWERYRESLGV